MQARYSHPTPHLDTRSCYANCRWPWAQAGDYVASEC